MRTNLHLWLIPVLPFLGFLLNGLFGRRWSKAVVATVALVTTGISFALVANIALHFRSLTLPRVETLGTWIAAGRVHVDFNFFLDPLTLVMLLVVTGVGFLIHVYSVGYMAHEEGFWRFFAYLNLFMFFMLALVLAESYLLMFVGWEGVGLASYLLIGYYFARNSAANAGRKAFVVNRVGDFGFLVAMFLMLAHFGSLSIPEVMGAIAQRPELQGGLMTGIALLLVLGATGKSAQIPLYVWLPDAMEGPTPVSALIHAATMVTAGIYMVARSHVLFDRSPAALGVVALIGAATAFFAATVGIVQTDIKRVLAYSTISQLGYMFMACGVAAYSAAIFHLVTHAFFKALLFLAAGSVIHAMSGEQDMRRMGGLRKLTPITFWTMTAGVFAIAGFFPFSGFFSKDQILYQAFLSGHGGKLLWAVGAFTAFMTSFYMFRLWYMTFFGARREAEFQHAEHSVNHPQGHSHAVHESPRAMLAPLVILAVLAVAGGWMGIPEALHGSDAFGRFLHPVFHSEGMSFEQASMMMNGVPVDAATVSGAEPATHSHGTELGLSVLAIILALLGLLLADLLYRRKPQLPEQFAAKGRWLYTLLVHKYWTDEFYAAVFTTPISAFSRLVLWQGVDRGLIDSASVGAGEGATALGSIVRKVQSGNIRSYAGWLTLGAAAMLALVVLFTYKGSW